MILYSFLKKIILINILSLGLIPSLISCNNHVNIKKDLIFTELYNGEDPFDTILEISLINKEVSNLTNYKLAIYNRSSLIYEYDLSKIDLVSNVILFINKDSSYILNSEVNLIKLNDNYLTPNYYYELTYLNNVIDVLGYKGINISYVNNESLVRLNECYTPSLTYNELNFVKVRSGVDKYLGNTLSPISKEELLKGPKLSEYYLNKEFQNNLLGGGGILEVSSYSLGDGDTTNFRFNSTLVKGGSTRYLLIDTPEISHGSGSYVDAEPFGNEAKRFNNKILVNSTKILVQSNMNFSLKDTYSRYLGYIWVTYKENPAISDYFLLNHQLVVNGLAKFSTYDKYETMYFKDILYYDYLNYGALYAKSLGLKIYGEIDPEFDYL